MSDRRPRTRRRYEREKEGLAGVTHPMTMSPIFVTPPQAAERLGCSAEKIIGFIRRGELRAVDLSDRPGIGKPRFRINVDDLDVFLRSREVSPQQRPQRRPRKDPHVIEFFR